MATSKPKIVGTAASVLMEATGDAMNNIFDVMIVFPWDSEGNDDAVVSYRCTGFEPPKVEVSTYPVTWHGITVQKVASGIKMERKQKLTFRLDATYVLYNKFKAWAKTVADVNTGGVANTASALGQIVLWAPGSEYNATSSFGNTNPNGHNGQLLKDTLDGKVTGLYWLLDDVQAIDVGQPKFENTAEGKSMNYDVNFIFGDVNDPFSTQPKEG